MVGPYKPRPEPVTVVPTAERVAVAIATAALKRELTKDESLVAVACGAYFGAELDEHARASAELRGQVKALQELLLDLYRESA